MRLPGMYKRLELQIGLTDLCNLCCRMCMQGAHVHGIYGDPSFKPSPLHEGHKGFLKRSLFEKIVKDLSAGPLHFRYILMHWLGESLLHPEFSWMLHHIAEHDFFDELMLFTNALNLDPGVLKQACKTLQAKDKKLILVFSLDASCRDTFLHIKGADAFDWVVENVKRIVKSDLPGLRFVYRFLVMPENHAEAGEFVRSWLNFVKSEINEEAAVTWGAEKPYDLAARHIINLRRTAGLNQAELESLHNDTVKGLGFSSGHEGRLCGFADLLEPAVPRPACAAPFRTPIINWDGRVTVCCADSELELCLGNVEEMPFHEIFLGEKAVSIRLAHLQNKRLPQRCMRCGNLMGPGLSDADVSALSAFYS